MQGKTGSISYRKQQKILPYLFVGAAFIIHACVVTIPSLSTLVMSFFDWNGIGGAKYIGLENFVEIFTKDRILGQALGNNLKWMMVTVPVPLILGTVIALMISRIKRGQILLRTVYFIPYVLSAVVVARIFSAYYNPYYGLNTVFEKLGWTKLADTLWLGDPDVALYAVAFVNNWCSWGYVMVLILSALQQVDPALYESARIDGASTLQELWHVAIPAIAPTLVFMMIMLMMFSFLSFGYIWVMTGGGPAHATETIATWIYRCGFSDYRAGYASAMCVLQSLICLVIILVERRLSSLGGLEE